jgi:hypothetical protein
LQKKIYLPATENWWLCVVKLNTVSMQKNKELLWGQQFTSLENLPPKMISCSVFKVVYTGDKHVGKRRRKAIAENQTSFVLPVGLLAGLQ